MKNKTLTAILAGIIAGLLVLGIGYWLYWVRSQDILPMAAEEQVQPVLAQVPIEMERDLVKSIETVEDSNMLDLGKSSLGSTDPITSPTNQVKGATTDFKRPDCVVKEISRPELGLSWRYQTCQNEQVSYRIDDNQVIEMVATPSATLEQAVMEVFEKKPTDTMLETLEKQFVSRLTEVAQIGCVPQMSTRITWTDSDKEVWEILPTGKYEQVAHDLLKRSPSAQPCGSYGYTPLLEYFEYHPKSATNRYIFVQGNLEETYFDRYSIVIE